MNEIQEKFRATLIGCAIGDTLGMPVEGWKKAQIEKYAGRITEPIGPVILRDNEGELIKEDEFGKLGYYSKGLLAFDTTDDTLLTTLLAESIAEKKSIDIEDIAKTFLSEYKRRILPTGEVLGGYGSTTLKSYKNLDAGISPFESAAKDGGPGNAPPMMMSPSGLWMFVTNRYVEGLNFAKEIGGITHRDPRSLVSGVIQANAIFNLLGGVSREEFNRSNLEVGKRYEQPISDNYPHFSKGNITSRLELIFSKPDLSDKEAFDLFGNNSLVFRSYPFTLFMFQKYWDSPIQGLLETVNWGGDSDTTGAMFGALAGAKNGMIFPQIWVDSLREKDRLIKAADGIFNLKKYLR